MKRHALALLAAVSATVTAAAQVETWRPELHRLVESYREGRFDLVADEAARAASATTDTDLRAELTALQACALLRSADRAARVDGRSRLAAAARQKSDLAERPDCLMALGVAETELNETSAALLHLHRAAAGFQKAGQLSNAAQATAFLARAWALHAEWESTPAELGIVTPASPEAALAQRIAQVERLRAAMPALGDRPAQQQVELVLARLLCRSDPASQARGEALLAALAETTPWSAESAGAAMELAARYEARGETAAAVALLRDVGDADLGELSRTARSRAAELARPRVHVEVAEAPPPGSLLVPRVSARGLSRVAVELRAIDLPDWLASQQGKLVAAALPDSGSLAASATLDTTAAAEYGEWRSTGDEPALQWRPDAGAYVLVARGSDGAGRIVEERRLLVVGRVRGELIVGRERGVIWATHADGRPLREATCEFWCFGSFAPTPVRITEGVGVFRLPGEAAMFRDRRCVGVIRSAGELGLFTAELPAVAARHEGPSVVLLPSALTLAPGDRLSVKGVLLPPAGSAVAVLPPERYRLGVLDSADRVVMRPDLRLTPLGTFAIDVPIPVSLASESFRLSVTADEREVPNACGAIRLTVLNRARSEARVELRLPRWIESGQAVRGVVQAEYPWGTPVRPTDVTMRVGVLQLPDPGSGALGAMLPPVELAGELGAAGGWAFELDASAAGVTGRYTAFDAVARLRSSEGRMLEGRGVCVAAPQPVQLVLLSRPRLPRGGEEARLIVRVLDLTGAARGRVPALRVDGRALHLEPGDGPGEFITAPLAVRAGQPLAAQATLEYAGGSRIEVQALVHAAEDTPAGAELYPLTCHGVRSAGGTTRVELDRRCADPVLVLLESGEPLGAVALSGVPGAARVDVAGAPAPRAAQVLVARRSADGLRWVASGDVDDATPPLRVQLDETPAAGTPLHLDLQLAPGAGPAAVVVRLVNLSDEGLEPWWDLFSPDAAVGPIRTGLTLASAPTGERPPTTVAPAFTQATSRALVEGRSEWLSIVPVDASASVDVPVRRAGLHRLHVVARFADGRLASVSRTFDAPPGLQAELHLPPRMSLGDRAAAVVRLRNETNEPADVEVTADADAELALLRTTPRRTTVPSGAFGTVALELEAAAAGESELSVRVTARGDVRTLSATCRVDGLPPSHGLATGWLTADAAVVDLGRAADGDGTLCRVQGSWRDVLGDAARIWLDAPIEGTLCGVSELLWARAALSAGYGSLPLERLAGTCRTGAGRARLAARAASDAETLRQLASDRLIAASLRTGGWGRWSEPTMDPASTAWVLLALDDGFEAGGERDATRKAADRLWAAVQEGLRADRLGPSDAMDALLLCALARGARDGRRASAWGAVAGRLEAKAQQLESGARLALVLAFQRAGQPERARAVLEAWGAEAAGPRDAGLRGAARLLTAGPVESPSDELLQARFGSGWADFTACAWALLALGAGPSAPADGAGALIIRGRAGVLAQVDVPLPKEARGAFVLPRGAETLEWTGSGGVSLVVEADPPRAGTIRVERSITVLTLDPQGGRAERAPFIEGQSLPPGAVLDVRERWQVETPLDWVEWVQPLPPALAPRPRSGQPTESPLGSATLGVEQVEFVGARLAAGSWTHAYELVTIRPGVYSVPAPRAWADGRQVTVVSDAWRVAVGP